MGDTKIEWTEKVWNPVTGCAKVSAGCKNCYAERLFPKVYPGRKFSDVRVHEDRLEQPLRWRKPRMVFVNSMSDLFHEDVPLDFIAEVFNTMSCATVECGKRHKHEEECWTGPPHTFQILTKRPERAREVIEELPRYVGRHYGGEEPLSMAMEVGIWPLLNVWLGVSVEDQATADERIPVLLDTPAAVRFVSYEPALGPVDFTTLIECPKCKGMGYFEPSEKLCLCLVEQSKGWTPGKVPMLNPLLHWIIAGGESGSKARDADPDWFRSVRDQCAAAGVAFFMKQMTKKAPIPDDLMIREYPTP